PTLTLHSFPTRRSSDLILERGIDGVHKLVVLQASLSPARVKIRSWMFGKNLSLGATLVHPMFHAIANGNDHIAEGFYARAVGHLDRKSTRLNSSHVAIS